MSEANADLAGLIDFPRLSEWLSKHVPALGDGPLKAGILSGGASNVVVRLDRGATPLVLRRPPKQLRPDSKQVIAREARILKALATTDVPHPRFYAYCDDDAVTGAPFYVMALIDGWAGHMQDRPLPPPFDQPENVRKLPFALIEGIARLANVDYKAVGLEGLGKPEGFLTRQVDRWNALLASYKESEGYAGRPLPGLQYAADWLKANTPAMSPAGIIHGDYSLANAMFAPDPPPKLAAMVDWELGTIGDPLLDLGWVLYAYHGRDDKTPPAGYFDSSMFPKREELAEYYAERTGRDVSNLRYYMILAQFKAAAILERHYARMLNGRQTKAMGERIGDLVLRLSAKAGEMASAVG
jgi:aminoglycoside phosphotransferase (APT) family kinase protein